MAYPEKGATYSHKPKWLEAARRAEGGGIDGGELTEEQKQIAQQVMGPHDAVDQEVDRPAAPDKYDLRQEDGLSAAKQRLNDLGLGNSMTISGPREKE
jgi:hypothetical protein